MWWNRYNVGYPKICPKLCKIGTLSGTLRSTEMYVKIGTIYGKLGSTQDFVK